MSKTKSSLDGQSRGYKIFVVIVLALLAVFFIFPLYWILTGSLKDAITINAQIICGALLLILATTIVTVKQAQVNE